MDFCMQVAMDQGYLLPKNQGASCWDKKVRAKTVPSLPRAAALSPLKIFKKDFNQQNPLVLSYNSCF